MPDLVQQTIFRDPDAEIETVDGVMSWDDYLHTQVKQMRKHGRQAKIKKDGGQLALFVDLVAHSDKNVMRDAMLVNVEGRLV